MSGTASGGKKLRARLVATHGGEAGYKAYMASLGSKGGRISKRHLSSEEAQALGRLTKGIRKTKRSKPVFSADVLVDGSLGENSLQ